MTVEQKRDAIESYCHKHGCLNCALSGKTTCYTNASPEEIEENYRLITAGEGAVKPNNVSHPSHYNQGGIECIDAMVAAFGKEAVENFCLLNAFKYVWRNRNKNGSEDIDKAIWYLTYVKELIESE